MVGRFSSLISSNICNIHPFPLHASHFKALGFSMCIPVPHCLSVFASTSSFSDVVFNIWNCHIHSTSVWHYVDAYMLKVKEGLTGDCWFTHVHCLFYLVGQKWFFQSLADWLVSIWCYLRYEEWCQYTLQLTSFLVWVTA